ncbi:MAG: hypothetical protein ACXAB7_10295 [Candidatus Kariarchaeaceae archaeon]|jgi:hypothetical protein
MAITMALGTIAFKLRKMGMVVSDYWSEPISTLNTYTGSDLND